MRREAYDVDVLNISHDMFVFLFVNTKMAYVAPPLERQHK